MIDFAALSTEQIILALVVLAAMIAISIVFNKHIDGQVKYDRFGPNNGMYVVIGVGYTLLGATLILWILYGLQLAVGFIVTTMLCFVASGLPMMIGATTRNTRLRYEDTENAKQAVRDAEQLVRETQFKREEERL
jgi:hypothetical protein